MTPKEAGERKKYRNSLIIHALIGIAGIAAGLYVFKYTGLLGGAAEGYAFICRADAKELFTRYFSEARYLILLFLAGFTIFGAPAAVIFAAVRGFTLSVGILRLAESCTQSGIDTVHFVITASAMSAVFAVELIMAAKAERHAATLNYTAPKVRELVRNAETGRYAATFAMLCAFLFAATAAVYFAPLLPI